MTVRCMSKHQVAVLKVVSAQLSVTAAAAQCGISRGHLHRLLRRYREGGLEAVGPQSRRPHSSPQRTSGEVRDRIVELRTELVARGLDAGDSITSTPALSMPAAAFSRSPRDGGHPRGPRHGRGPLEPPHRARQGLLAQPTKKPRPMAGVPDFELSDCHRCRDSCVTHVATQDSGAPDRCWARVNHLPNHDQGPR